MDEAWIDTVRLAREFGTVSELYPPGITDIKDLPWPLFEAIRAAQVYIGFDELPDDDRPPRRIWDDADQLREWFAEVRRKRERELKGDGNRDIDDPVDNEAAKALIVG